MRRVGSCYHHDNAVKRVTTSVSVCVLSCTALILLLLNDVVQVNPGSVILSGEMMFRHLGWNEAADLIIKGIDASIQVCLSLYQLIPMHYLYSSLFCMAGISCERGCCVFDGGFAFRSTVKLHTTSTA